MALSKDRKVEIVDDVGQLLMQSKLTVMARYSGTSVKSLQRLRQTAKPEGTTVKVVKNRLVKQALADNSKFKDFDPGVLSGQLLYAFNAEDEVAPAAQLANFAKTEPQIEFIGAINADGQFMAADDVKALAGLPSKQQLRGMLAGTIAGPLSGFANVLSGNLRGLINAMSARADQIS